MKQSNNKSKPVTTAAAAAASSFNINGPHRFWCVR